MDEIEYDVSRERYNEFVQQVQTEADAFHMEHRIRQIDHDDGRIDGMLEVYWEGWLGVGSESRAMTPEARRLIHPGVWEDIKAKAVHELLKS